jgi:EmrB/QacA subfamily drug resistance transporter
MYAQSLHAHTLHAHACSTMPRMAFSSSAPATLDRRAWGALLVLCGALFLDGLDISMVGVALPSIEGDLHLSTSTLQWIVSGYVLGYGGLLLLGGRAADLLGRRRVFIAALAVFAVASLLGALTSDGTLLIATRFLKGLSAAFTAPASLSIITTTFPEGPARNKALAVWTATGASGFSSGLILGGLLTEIGWRWTFLLPAPIAALLVLGALRLVPDSGRPARDGRGFDLRGAGLVAATMLLFVFTIVEAPSAGWTSLRTTASVLAVLALGAAFVAAEQRAPHPLIRLGILRSASLRRANLGAMAVAGGWFAFQFVGTLYLQQLRGWSAIEMAVAFLPAGLLVAFGAPRSGELVDRFGTTRVTAVGMAAFVGAYALVLPIGADSPYLTAMLPTMLLAGIGFMCAFGPLNVAATNGIADHEQGLASGLVQTSFQLGGAVGLAVATAVIDAGTTHSASAPGSAAAMLDGFHPALLVSLTVAALGLLVTVGGVLPAAVRSLAAGHARPATEDVR